MTFGPISVPMKPLRQIVEELGIIECDLLKVDTEGFETFVLRSLGEFLQPAKVKHIIAEIGEEGLKQAGTSKEELYSLGIGKGYSCEVLQGKKRVESEKALPDLPDFVVKDLHFF